MKRNEICFFFVDLETMAGYFEGVVWLHSKLVPCMSLEITDKLATSFTKVNREQQETIHPNSREFHIVNRIEQQYEMK